MHGRYNCQQHEGGYAQPSAEVYDTDTSDDAPTALRGVGKRFEGSSAIIFKSALEKGSPSSFTK